MSENRIPQVVTVLAIVAVLYLLLKYEAQNKKTAQTNATAAVAGASLGLASSIISAVTKCNLKTKPLQTSTCAIPLAACYVAPTSQSPSTSVLNAPSPSPSLKQSQSNCCGCNSASCAYGIGANEKPASTVLTCVNSPWCCDNIGSLG